MHRILMALAAALTLAAPASAAVVRDCDETASARNIVEPWATYTRTFYKGQVRVALLDTGGEPVCCSLHLLVTLPPNDNDPGSANTCFVISDHGDFGYGRIDFDKIATAYDQNKGLLVTVPAAISNGDEVQSPATIRLRVNVAKSSVAIEK